MIVFDMDGVLAEVTESYREASSQTVQFFTGKRITRDLIQDYKNQGGWNNDWALSQKIASDLGVEVPYRNRGRSVQQDFLRHNNDGLIARESWFPKPGLLERLGQQYELGLFTGRLQYEPDITLKRFAPDIHFDPIICAEHVQRRQTRAGGPGVDPQAQAGPQAFLCRRYGGRRALGPRGWCAVYRDRGRFASFARRDSAAV